MRNAYAFLTILENENFHWIGVYIDNTTWLPLPFKNNYRVFESQDRLLILIMWFDCHYYGKTRYVNIKWKQFHILYSDFFFQTENINNGNHGIRNFSFLLSCKTQNLDRLHSHRQLSRFIKHKSNSYLPAKVVKYCKLHVIMNIDK